MSGTGIGAIGLAVALALPVPERPQVATPVPAPDGRLLGHLPYVEVAPAELVAAPPGFAILGPCRVHRDAAPDLARLLAAAARAPELGKRLRAVSCFRSVAHQRAVFCRASPRGICSDPRERARYVGPPGFSEHATGYAIDFGTRPSPGCPDVNACIAATPAGRWLLAHAPQYGFELSFPSGNPQGVTWEPWHWRWVGVSSDVPGAATARLVFARARGLYPASPAVIDAPAAATIVTVTTPPPVTLLPPEPTSPPPEQRRRHRR